MSNGQTLAHSSEFAAVDLIDLQVPPVHPVPAVTRPTFPSYNIIFKSRLGCKSVTFYQDFVLPASVSKELPYHVFLSQTLCGTHLKLL